MGPNLAKIAPGWLQGGFRKAHDRPRKAQDGSKEAAPADPNNLCALLAARLVGCRCQDRRAGAAYELGAIGRRAQLPVYADLLIKSAAQPPSFSPLVPPSSSTW